MPLLNAILNIYNTFDAFDAFNFGGAKPNVRLPTFPTIHFRFHSRHYNIASVKFLQDIEIVLFYFHKTSVP